MNKQTILFENKFKVLIDNYAANEENALDVNYIATAMRNIEELGFTFSQELIEKIKKMNIETFGAFYNDVVKMCKKAVGGHIQHKPMYPNFPQQVMEAEESELYIRAILHYIFGVLPETEEIERLPLIQNVKLKVIDVGTNRDFEKLVANLINAKTSISEENKKIISWTLTNESNVAKYLPEEIYLKENLGFVLGLLTELNKTDLTVIKKYFKTATDVLRYGTQLSGGDVSLSENTKYKKFNRRERKLLLSLLEANGRVVEDMLRYKERWLRLGEIIHPGEFKNRYPRANMAFKALRENAKIPTFAGMVEEAVQKGDMPAAVELLSKRPGEFARRLDNLLRVAEKENVFMSVAILVEFEKVVENISTPVIIQLIGHFENRCKLESTTREFFPKGQVSKMWIRNNELEPISEKICDEVVNVCKEALKKRFIELDGLGKVYLDEKLKNCLIPFSERSASKSLKTFARGSKFDIEETTKFIRLFLYWKQPDGERVDIDTSVVGFDEEFKSKTSVTYNKLRDARYGMFHSGDITSAPNGASEFIDIDIEKAIANGVRYLTMTAHSFTNTPYCNLPECFVGWMEREDNVTGKVFEPKTVQNKIDIATNQTEIMPVVFDLVERKVVWADLGMNSSLPESVPNNVEKHALTIASLSKAMLNIKKMNLYDLFALHAEVRGEEVVETKEEADTIFSLDEGITPRDFDVIAAEYIA